MTRARCATTSGYGKRSMMSGDLVLSPKAKTHYVLDTWPVMEWLKNRQPQPDWFRSLLVRASEDEVELWMSMMNVGEVYYSSAREWGADRADEILSRMRELPIALVPVDDDEIFSASRLKIKPGILYADAFAAAFAIRLNCQLITADKDFQALEEAGVLRLEWWDT